MNSTQESRLLKGKLKYGLQAIASKFERIVCDCFQDCIYQFIIWSEENVVCIKGTTSDIQGNLKTYLMEFDPEKDCFNFVNVYADKGFYNNKARRVFKDAFIEFLADVIDIFKTPIHKIVIDMSISDTYRNIRIMDSNSEEGTVDLIITSHTDSDKKEWGIF